MFAVPGWSLPERAVTQTAPVKEASIPDFSKENKAKSKSKPKSKKRKNGQDALDDVNNFAAVMAEVEAKKREQQEQSKSKPKPKTEIPASSHDLQAPQLGSQIKDLPNKKRKKDKDSSEKQTLEKSSSKPTSLPTTETKSKPTPAKGSSQAQKPETLSQSTTPASSSTALTPAQPKLTPLQMKMKAKLTSARFRHLNETLYTKPSQESLTMISSDPTLFTEYHDGFSQQVSSWPTNPVDGYVKDIRTRGSIQNFQSKADKFKTNYLEIPLPRDRRFGQCHVVDLGAGTAPLARALQKDLKKMNIKLSSFDLHSTSPLVQVADIANLPLRDGTVDVAIFCLALMGTNWLDFIDEAYRVLHWKGELWVAEVKSRLGRIGGSSSTEAKPKPKGKKAKKQGGADDEEEEPERQLKDYIIDQVDGDGKTVEQTDLNPFIDALRKRGFVLNTTHPIERDNKMFVKLWFTKAATPVKGKNVPTDNRQYGAESSVEVKKRKGKFLDDPEDNDDESKILKPCVYKVR